MPPVRRGIPFFASCCGEFFRECSLFDAGAPPKQSEKKDVPNTSAHPSCPERKSEAIRLFLRQILSRLAPLFAPQPSLFGVPHPRAF